MSRIKTPPIDCIGLKEILSYNPETGDFTWISSVHKRNFVGKIAGGVLKTPDGKRYLGISIKNRTYKAHRLAWLYITGSYPDDVMDHIDGNGLNNKWENLRAVTHAENNKNQRLSSANKSGICGVCWSKKGQKWFARIYINSKNIHLGSFDDIEEAKAVRLAAEIKNGYHENHGSVRPL